MHDFRMRPPSAEASVRFAIPEHWIRAVMRVESAGNPQAVSRAGAMGLMQVMPGTWAELRQHHGLGPDPFEPRDNILAGTAYLRAMLDRYGTVGAMLAAYNAGPGRYDEFLSTGRPLPAETRAYVATLAPLLDGDGALPHRHLPLTIGAKPRSLRTDQLQANCSLRANRRQRARRSTILRQRPHRSFSSNGKARAVSHESDRTPACSSVLPDDLGGRACLEEGREEKRAR